MESDGLRNTSARHRPELTTIPNAAALKIPATRTQPRRSPTLLSAVSPSPTPRRSRTGWARPRPRCSCWGPGRCSAWSSETCSRCRERCRARCRDSPTGSPASAPAAAACPAWRRAATARWRWSAAESAGPAQRPARTGRWSGRDLWNSLLHGTPLAARRTESRSPGYCRPGSPCSRPQTPSWDTQAKHVRLGF